jgi:hypothetical protein
VQSRAYAETAIPSTLSESTSRETEIRLTLLPDDETVVEEVKKGLQGHARKAVPSF